MHKYIISFICLFSSSISAQSTYHDSLFNYWPDSRYTDNGDGTITDNETSLMWMQCMIGQDSTDSCSGDASSGKSLWSEALATADTYVFAGHSDWRLPNIKELLSLFATDRVDPAININIFPNHPTSGRVWSSTPSDDDNSAWIIEIDSGRYSEIARTSNRHIRLVRTAD